jgi:hypothetical protein
MDVLINIISSSSRTFGKWKYSDTVDEVLLSPESRSQVVVGQSNHHNKLKRLTRKDVHTEPSHEPILYLVS